MPALIVGHPFHAVYADTIGRLKRAATQAGQEIQVMVYVGFLNEVVSHRRLAEEEMRFVDRDERETLRRQAMFVGSLNMNVFVSAYAKQLMDSPNLTFSGFISLYAPFSDEKQLAKWLTNQGITVVEQHEVLEKEPDHAQILHTLEVEYADEVVARQKIALLISHDAVQLGAMQHDIRIGRRSIFVTADKRLREKIGGSKFAYLSNTMISPLEKKCGSERIIL